MKANELAAISPRGQMVGFRLASIIPGQITNMAVYRFGAQWIITIKQLESVPSDLVIRGQQQNQLGQFFYASSIASDVSTTASLRDYGKFREIMAKMSRKAIGEEWTWIDEKLLDQTETPATQLLNAIKGWNPEMKPQPVSNKGLMGFICGYEQIVTLFPDKPDPAAVFMQIRESEASIVELQSIIAYPDHNKMGTETIKRLVDEADKFKVAIWADVVPYGADREAPSVEKLMEIYARFGFVKLQVAPDYWKTQLHEISGWCGRLIGQAAIRFPKEANATS